LVLVLAILATACGGDEHPSAPSADASANLQVRRVENVVIRSSPEWDATELTCPGEDAGACLAATRADSVVVMDADEVKYLLGPVVVDGGDVEEAKAYEDPVNEGWTVSTPLSPEGSEALASATRGAVRALPPKDQIAIVVERARGVCADSGAPRDGRDHDRLRGTLPGGSRTPRLQTRRRRL